MKLFRRARLLVLGVPLAIGSLALAAAPASASTHPGFIYPVYAPAGNLTLSVPISSMPMTCPSLHITGANFGKNDTVNVTLYTGNPGVYWTGWPNAIQPNYAYNVTIQWGTDVSGNLSGHPFPSNSTSGFQYWQAVATENGHLESYSNIVECAP
jgi:hypothetical protein